MSEATSIANVPGAPRGLLRRVDAFLGALDRALGPSALPADPPPEPWHPGSDIDDMRHRILSRYY